MTEIWSPNHSPGAGSTRYRTSKYLEGRASAACVGSALGVITGSECVFIAVGGDLTSCKPAIVVTCSLLGGCNSRSYPLGGGERV